MRLDGGPRMEARVASLAVVDTRSPADRIVGGDWISECMALFSEAHAAEHRLGLQAVRIEQQQRLDWRREALQAIQAKIAASNKSGWLKGLGIVVGVSVALVSAVATIYCPPAAAGIAVGGALISGGLGVAGAYSDQDLTRAEGRLLRCKSQREQSLQYQNVILDTLQQAAQAQWTECQRLHALAESMSRIDRCAMDRTRRNP